MATTVMTLMKETAARYAELPALKSKNDQGGWDTVTWKDYYQEIIITAKAFMALGLDAQKAVAIVGNNCPQWFYSDLGAIFAGGVPVGIYATNTPEQCQYITEHSDAAVVVVEDQDQLAKFKQLKGKLPNLKAIVLIKGSDNDKNVYSWKDLPSLAEKITDEELEKRINAQKPDDLCTLIYTSGTTGDPKGVMLSHDNITWTTKTIVEMVKSNSKDRLISYLPLSHIAEQVVSVHSPLVTGASVYFAENLEKLGDNLREVHPTIFVGVPRVWEKIQEKMMAAGAQNSPIKKKIAAWARKIGLKGGYADQENSSRPFLYFLANKLVFSKVRDKLGLDQCRLCMTTAAPISLDTLEFFLSLSLPLCEVYGMSELTGPGTTSLPWRYKTGKAGFVINGADIKLAEDQEILFKGRSVFKGYFKNPEATKETLDDDGWVHTGDVGEIDADNFLKITDRKKELIITAGGENIAPQEIEGKLKAIAAVSQAVVIGDRRKYLTALLTLNGDKVMDEASIAGSPATNMEEASKCDKFIAHIQNELDLVNPKLARVQTIKKFTILPQELTLEGDELTPTMKLKRRVVNDKYDKEIENMYQ